MTHLLIIHQAFASANDVGGTRHFEFAKHMIARSDRVTVVTSPLNYQTAGRRSQKDRIAVDPADPAIFYAPALSVASKTFPGRIAAFFTFMVSSIMVAIKVRRVDVVMGTSPPIFQAFSAYLVARIKGCPFLLEIRDLWPDFAIDIGILRNSFLIRLSHWAELFLYRHADHLIVNSPAYVGHITSKGIDPRKLSLIPNGVSPEMFNPDDDGAGFRKRYDLQNKFLVVYAGALGLANDIPTILRAAERLLEDPGIVFVLAGDGKERRRLEAEAQQRNLTNVLFLGGLPKVGIPEVLAAADACVATLTNIPMFGMTYPNKVFDYMAAGRPVILGITGVIREVIERAEAGTFVPPGDDADLAQAVRRLKNHPELGLKMGRDGRSYVERHFNRHDHASSFLELVRNLGTTFHE